MVDNYPQMAQGQAVPANAKDIAHDKSGITYPNLHRRIDNEATDGEHVVSVSGVNSYRTTKHTVHDESSEVP